MDYVNLDPQESIKRGVELVYNAVSSTYGPNGNSVLIYNGSSPKITKDGITVAKYVSSDDPYESLGISLVVDASAKANSIAGDGSTTTAILASLLIGNIPKENSHILKQYLNKLLETLKSMSTPVESLEDLQKIAKISCNGDEKLAEVIAKAVFEVGAEGVLSIERNFHSEDFEYTVTKGFRLQAAPVDFAFIDKSKQVYRKTYEEAKVVVLKNPMSLQNMVKYIDSITTPTIFIVHEISEALLNSCLNNHLMGKLNINILRFNMSSGHNENILEDLKSVLESKNIHKVEVSTDGLLVYLDGTSTETVQKRISLINEQINTSSNELTTRQLSNRRANLEGNIGTIYIPATTDIIYNEIHDRAEDAINATKSAYREGYVVGGGMALKKAAECIDVDTVDSIEGKLRILLNCPYRLVNRDNSPTEEELLSNGIIDPLHVVSTALKTAIEVASLALNTKVAIVDKLSYVAERQYYS